MKRGLSIAVAAALLALVVASCGGGGSDESTATSAEASAQSEAGGGGEAGEATGSNPKPAKKASQPKGGESPESSGSPSGGESEPAQPSEEAQGKTKKKPSLSPQKRFVRQANAICSERRKQLLADLGEYLKEHASQSGKQQALVEATRAVLVPDMEAQVVAIRKLEAPPGSAHQVDAFLAAWQRSLDTAAKAPKPLVGTYATQLLEPAGNRARRLGLRSCVYS